jgi:RNA polymerase sigma-70 factor (ECF subfamily)
MVAPKAEPQAATSEDLELWVRFHQAVDELPVEEREVVGLVFYHGWTQVRIAELFNVDERTIRRRWTNACERLRTMVGDVIRE